MCNGGEGRTLKPCCDAALASSRYISNGPAKAHSLPTLPSALPPLNPSLPGPPRLALAGLPPSFASTRSPFPSPSSPEPIALARARARQRRRFLSSESSFHIPGSQVAVRRRRLGGRWNTRGPIQITGLPSYPGSFFLSPSPSSYLPPSLSLFLHLPGLILRHFFFFAFCPPSRFFFLFYIPRLCPSQSQSQLLLYLFHLSLFPFFPSFVFEFWRRS